MFNSNIREDRPPSAADGREADKQLPLVSGEAEEHLDIDVVVERLRQRRVWLRHGGQAGEESALQMANARGTGDLEWDLTFVEAATPGAGSIWRDPPLPQFKFRKRM